MVYGKWILYCLLRGQLIQKSNWYLKDFKVLIYFDNGKLSVTTTSSN